MLFLKINAAFFKQVVMFVLAMTCFKSGSPCSDRVQDVVTETSWYLQILFPGMKASMLSGCLPWSLGLVEQDC